MIVSCKGCALTAVLAGLSGALACGADTEGQLGSASAALHARDRDALWEGKTLEEWAVQYVRWYYSATDCDGFPTNDPDGSLCGKYQDPDSPVFFFDRSPGRDGGARMIERQKCTVPAEKAILVPVAAFFGDKAGMVMPMSDEQIETTVASVKDSMRRFLLRADGLDIRDVEQRCFGPVRLNYFVPAAPNRYGCDDSRGVSDVLVDPSFLAGCFVLFDPPSSGRHELEYASTLTFSMHDYSFHVRNNFEVLATSE